VRVRMGNQAHLEPERKGRCVTSFGRGDRDFVPRRNLQGLTAHFGAEPRHSAGQPLKGQGNLSSATSTEHHQPNGLRTSCQYGLASSSSQRPVSMS